MLGNLDRVGRNPVQVGIAVEGVGHEDGVGVYGLVLEAGVEGLALGIGVGDGREAEEAGGILLGGGTGDAGTLPGLLGT
ncbi:MAG: hypothetical protein QUS33_13875 [Dehalococcoidia bacterium]|nr:hypothetical protein [Dehalococcoidia bacterium]